MEAVDRVIQKAARVHRMSRIRQQAAALLGQPDGLTGDRAVLEASFDRALEKLWVAYQPIVDVRQKLIYGYEALMRTHEPSLPHPGAMLDAAERLGTLDVLGRLIRDRAATPFLPIADGIPAGATPQDAEKLFVNLHVTDLLDDWLMSPEAPLTKIANRVVLELTERASLSRVPDVRVRIAQLRELGFKIAVDDMGAGYAGLSSFATLEPELVKLDMSLIRDVHQSSVKQKVVGSITRLSKDMGMVVVAEGVECSQERDALIDLGCDLLQGFFFAKPAYPFPEVQW
jgi:EAL domain-containing protein (putative c-di-GMP-specific phosphodiesterase class I)